MAEKKDGSVESVYSEKRVFYPPKEFVEKARLKSLDEYKKMWERSIKDPTGFWGEMASKHIDWFKKWDGAVEEYSFKHDRGGAHAERTVNEVAVACEPSDVRRAPVNVLILDVKDK